MAENITLAPVSSFTNDSSAVATVNANSTLITTAFADCLSLDGTQPNQMQSNLDMNSNQIINLPPPNNLNSPVRLVDLASITNSGTITVSTLPTGGSTNALLHKNSGTNYDATWTLTPSGLTSIGATTSTVTTSNITGTAVLTGSTSGTTTLQASAIASGTLTLPAATDTLTGRATTDTLTNKTFDTAGTGNVFKAGGVTTSTVTGTGAIVLGTSPAITTPGIVGFTDGSNATAGNVGEVISSTIAVGSAVSVTTASLTNITSISLTAGDWEVSGNINYINSAGTSTLTSLGAGISTTSATFDNTTGNKTALVGCGGSTWNAITGTSATGALQVGITAPTSRFSSNSTQTVYLVGFIVATGTITGYGSIHARRMR